MRNEIVSFYVGIDRVAPKRDYQYQYNTNVTLDAAINLRNEYVLPTAIRIHESTNDVVPSNEQLWSTITRSNAISIAITIHDVNDDAITAIDFRSTN